MKLAETTDSALYSISNVRTVTFNARNVNKFKQKGKHVKYPDAYHGPMPMDVDFAS